ncbi:MAG: SUMF1/EgtB/PvdO family nonheme iron enzyme [Chloroflexi bacterium]|uniref:SUMF1/EgtB/PvdO family nonheme iron enzyme n=1 Tax=Candidatus Flexifilum breve TaxID=3140694 RepID=UPI003135B9E3|nr:SUMF1/EgtB/PvdO family nonheme iron enzyme [Chloroflexota bacterium]
MFNLSDPITEQIVQSVAAAIWSRPELTRFREPIRSALRGDQFRRLTHDAVDTFAQAAQVVLPQFFDAGFIDMPTVQERLAAYIVRGQQVDIDGLAEDYTRRFLTPADAPTVREQLVGYLKTMRETFATHSTYGAILLARDIQSMTAALNNLRGEMHGRFDEVIAKLDALLREPEIKALVERKRGNHVFLSYTRRNLSIVAKIRNALEDAGHRVWQDTTAIPGGDDWIESIADGIRRAYAVVTVVSAEAQESRWVRLEFLEAERRKKKILPIKVDGCEIPMVMLDMNVIHAHPDFDTGVHGLLAALPAHPIPTETVERPADPPKIDRRQLELDYLEALIFRNKVWQEVYTPMAGVGQMRVDAPEDDPIEMVTAPAEIAQEFARFIDKRLKPREQPMEKREYGDMLEAVAEMRQLVILGEPGAGKTSTLWRIAVEYAQRAKADPTQPIPVFVRLGELGTSKTVAAQIRAALGGLGEHFDALLNEKRVVLLFDGLNELPTDGRAENVTHVKRLIERAQRDAGIAIVTCRELDYVGALDMGIPERIVITPLDPLRIRQFANAYIKEPAGRGDALFWELAGQEVQHYWKRFEGDKDVRIDPTQREAVFWLADDLPEGVQWGYDNWTWREWRKTRHQPRSLLTLASNPFMLYMMTGVYTQKRRIPPNRGELFGTFVDFLLTKREKLDKAAADHLRARLADLAFAMQAQGEGTAFPLAAVMAHLGDEQALYAARSANLLSGSDPIRFTHQLLQEYFAAQRLDREMNAERPARDFWKADSWWQPTGWEETAILLAGLYSDDTTPVIEWMRDAQPELTARCILESGAQTPQTTLEALHPRWIPRLTDLNTDPMPEARANVGRALGLLHLDDRPGVGLRPDGLPDIQWCEIPAGTYPIGGDKDAYEPLEAQKYVVKQAYKLAKYPITYVQFEVFLKAEDGFGRDTWWDGLTPDYRKQPMAEQSFKYDNHPRENVSWYQAVAYTHWLTAQYRAAGLLPEEWEIRLPTEQEWETAARYPDGRVFAWDSEYISGYANIDETKTQVGPHYLHQTSSVGLYPQGRNPSNDLYDLSGNVWEWTLSEWDEPEQARLDENRTHVRRGGSWLGVVQFARAASRYGSNPELLALERRFSGVCAPIESADR